MEDETTISEVTDNTEAAENIDNIENGENIENIESIETGEVPVVSGLADEKTSARNLRKERIGIVVSNKMQKTIVVKIEESVKHSRYSKILRRSIKFKAHDEKNECDIGDKVLIMETRPLSRDKRWRLVKILEKVK